MSYKAGYVGLIGQPNAGKSSLMNYIIKEKVSIVTNKPQTTRRRILGIHTAEQAQIVFIDAPGVIKATKGLNSFLEKEAMDVIRESDALVAVLSLDQGTAEEAEQILEMVKSSRKPWVAVINKIDLDEKFHRVLILKEMIQKFGGKAILISTQKPEDDYRTDFLKAIEDILPEATHPLYEDDIYTTENMRELVAEIVREQCFENLNYEIPYQLAVQVRKYDEEAKPCPKIYVDVLVAKDSQKPILIGKGAELIKKISQKSRQELEKIIGEKIFLEVNVVVKDNWFEHLQTMKELGYVIERK
ncbi:MAG: GTPase Era [Bdellovibrionales bacterium RIFCSPHIGHO2_01_FULL_40_29]|nr:MAG: GTPase Era [Bdellovibrionales bacterium RIFCSPHIGHO2_01_FULL_40_29]OFZ34373.1 MAG: GTPase Era [Bdellovibrionales bacterium RIFCSPHIGHO2_02_FULL_40_15]